MMVYSRDGGVRVTIDLADDQDGDTLTVSDVDTFRSPSILLNGGWQTINLDLQNDLTDINPSAGNNTRDNTIRSITFRFVTEASYTANDTIHLAVDQIQNSDASGFAFLTVMPLNLSPDVLVGQSKNYPVYLQNLGSTTTALHNTTL